MSLVLALTLVPILSAVLLLGLRSNFLRRCVVIPTVLFACVGTIWLACVAKVGSPGEFPVDHHILGMARLVLELVMGLYILWVGIRNRRWLIAVLVLVQTAVSIHFEFTNGSNLKPGEPFFIDHFTIIMALINGIVGGGICVYALGYMKEYHEKAHTDVRDRRPLFFSLLFLFMGAMFGLVFSNDLLWLFFFWEITTFCSFLLIGYTQTEVARNNALRALVMNLSGGLAFALAISVIYEKTGKIELQALMGTMAPQLLLLPAALLCFAGITKSAQYPFSSWLLGAMVAPTPVSALLHSSTMVKAGVYLVLRLAPVVSGTWVGLMVALVGGVTFLVASLAAITTPEAKRVLAYSTIANLGLVVLCGGIGTAEAVWAGILLIIFHAVAKCLLFLCVGVVEHKIHSRDIEDMSGLILRMPKVAVMMLVGMAGMFLAPFGMLISKWAVLRAIVEAWPLLAVFIAFGSAATLFFWVKWMGKLVEPRTAPEKYAHEISAEESVALFGLSAATFFACLFFPFLSSHFIEPYLNTLYTQPPLLGQSNNWLMMGMMLVVMLFPFSFLSRNRGVKLLDPYLSGANATGSKFLGSGGQTQDAVAHNYYLRNVLDETALTRSGVFAGVVLLALMIGITCL